MGLHQLPAELQLEICTFLDNISLKAARAVCKKLRDNASPALFRSIVACARYEALGAFQNISVNSILQTYVKEIVFDGSIYSPGPAINEQVYEREAQKFENLQQTSFWGNRTRSVYLVYMVSELQLMRHRWKRYKALYMEQEDMKLDGVLLQTMAKGLEWTTNVASIVYSPHPHLLPTESKVMRDLLPRGTLIDSPHFHASQLSAHSSGHPFRFLIGALYVAQYTGVRELRIKPLRAGEPGTPFTLTIFDFPDAVDFKAGAYLFQRLERCELHFKSWIEENEVGKQRITNLRKMLAAAEELRNLALHFTDSMSDHEAMAILQSGSERTMISRLGLAGTWPKLRSLSLGGIYVQAEQLLDFIRRHRYTMNSLFLSKSGLDTGYWADIVDEVLYSTRILSFEVDRVREMRIPVGDGTVESTEELQVWHYEGHVKVSKDGERNFVSAIHACGYQSV